MRGNRLLVSVLIVSLLSLSVSVVIVPSASAVYTVEYDASYTPPDATCAGVISRTWTHIVWDLGASGDGALVVFVWTSNSASTITATFQGRSGTIIGDDLDANARRLVVFIVLGIQVGTNLVLVESSAPDSIMTTSTSLKNVGIVNYITAGGTGINPPSTSHGMSWGPFDSSTFLIGAITARNEVPPAIVSPVITADANTVYRASQATSTGGCQGSRLAVGTEDSSDGTISWTTDLDSRSVYNAVEVSPAIHRPGGSSGDGSVAGAIPFEPQQIECRGNNVVVITDTRPEAANGVLWSWEWGDNKTDTTSTPSNSHTYLGTGTRAVVLRVTDINGRINTFAGAVDPGSFGCRLISFANLLGPWILATLILLVFAQVVSKASGQGKHHPHIMTALLGLTVVLAIIVGVFVWAGWRPTLPGGFAL